MTTLTDIAKELGISPSLVSKVLNDRLGNTGARPELVEIIHATAERMHYRKNPSAVALRRGRQDVVGVFIHRFGRPGSGIVDALLQGLSAEARIVGKRFILDFFEEAEEFLAYKDMLNRSAMDGVLLGGLPHEELTSMLLDLQDSGMPIVTILDKEISSQLPTVSFDQIEAGRIATEHLIQQGCRNIAHVVDIDERYQGYRQALRKQEVSHNKKLVYREGGAEFTYERGVRAARYLLESKLEFDGVVAQSDEEALGVMNVLMDHGVRVPKEVRIIGMDNAPYCNFSRVPLSSVSQSSSERGRVAFKLLMELIDGEPVQSIAIPPELFVRASSQ